MPFGRGGLWKGATNWSRARDFVFGIANDAIGMTPELTTQLLNEEDRLYNFYFGSEMGLFYHSDDEKKIEIAYYAAALYAFVKDKPYPNQVKIALASFSDTTHTIGITKGSEYIDDDVDLSLLWWLAGAAAVVFVVTRK